MLCSPSPSPCCLAVYCVDKLSHNFIYSIAISVSVHAMSTAIVRSIIRKSYDISHPIGSMQIPLENTKTVQELPDPSFRVLVMQYIQRCGKGRGLDSRLPWLSELRYRFEWAYILKTWHLWQDLRKGTISRYSRIFILKRLYLRNHSSYELQTWHKYSSIILLHSLQIAGPAHFRCGRGARVDRVWKSPFCASLWQLTARDRRLTLASNVGSVK